MAEIRNLVALAADRKASKPVARVLDKNDRAGFERGTATLKDSK
jgi:hypothetical protein